MGETVLVQRILPEGPTVLVGMLDCRSQCFQYAPSYIKGTDPRAISMSLPLREEVYGPEQTLAYFEGLLPEGAALTSLAAVLESKCDDVFGMLDVVGMDCVADLCLSTTAGMPPESVVPISLKEIEDALGDRKETAAFLHRARLSLAGTQSKLGLSHMLASPIEEGWYVPSGSAGSTHILKASHLEDLPQLEYLCMNAARYCGIEAATTSLMGSEGNILVSERFDREVSVEHGKLRVIRRHVEDLCQAFGLPSHRKYEELEGGSLRVVADFIRRHSARVRRDLEQLARVVLFNYAIGNCDAHLKNFSILYARDWGSICLAPAYDLISTVRYQRFSRELGMRIGDAQEIDEVSAHSFELLAADLGIPASLLKRNARELADGVLRGVQKAMDLRPDDASVQYVGENLQADCETRLEVLRAYAD